MVLTGVFCLFQFAAFEPRLLAPGIGLLLALAVLTVLARHSRIRHDARVGLWLLLIGVVAGVTLVSGQSAFVASGLPFSGLLPLVLAASAAVAIGRSGRPAALAFALLLAAYAVITVGDLAMFEVKGDVKPLVQGGLDATLAGHTPYGIRISNPFNAEESAAFYGPGAIVDGRLIYGYPYLPVPLLLDIPAHVLGDARWMHLLSMIGAGALAWRLASDRIGRAAAVFLVINPLTTTVLLAYWVEPVMVLLLAASVWAIERGNRWTGVLVGLLFASKQFTVSFVPALWTLAHSSGWRAVQIASAVGVVLVGAFVVWDPQAFVNSAIEFHLTQPFRKDSISLLPGLDALVGPLPDWLLAVSPLVGLAVSGLVAVRTKPGATALALGVGLSLLVTVLLAKQAHMNYFLLIGAALLLAVITWPRDNPIPDPKA